MRRLCVQVETMAVAQVMVVGEEDLVVVLGTVTREEGEEEEAVVMEEDMTTTMMDATLVVRHYRAVYCSQGNSVLRSTIPAD